MRMRLVAHCPESHSTLKISSDAGQAINRRRLLIPRSQSDEGQYDRFVIKWVVGVASDIVNECSRLAVFL